MGTSTAIQQFDVVLQTDANNVEKLFFSNQQSTTDQDLSDTVNFIRIDDPYELPAQAEAEAGTETAARVWSAQRVSQAIGALAAFNGQLDGTAVTGTASTINFAVGDTLNVEIASGVMTVTIPTAAAPSPGTHTRRAAISADTILIESEAQAGTESTTQVITTPTWAAGVMRYLFVGVPTDEDDITDIASGGISIFSSYTAFADEVDGHKWWRTNDLQDGEFSSGIDLTITQG